MASGNSQYESNTTRSGCQRRITSDDTQGSRANPCQFDDTLSIAASRRLSLLCVPTCVRIETLGVCLSKRWQRLRWRTRPARSYEFFFLKKKEHTAVSSKPRDSSTSALTTRSIHALSRWLIRVQDKFCALRSVELDLPFPQLDPRKPAPARTSGRG